jgi:hypothetical protein
MDAEGAEDVRHRMRTAKTCGPDASMVGVKLGLSPPATVSTKPDHRGERAISRKPLRAERRVVSVYLW